MIAWKFKLWRTAGAAAVLGLAACGGEGGEAGAAGEAGEAAVSSPAGEAGEAAAGEGGGEFGEAGISAAFAGVAGDQRTALQLQRLKGFVLIAARTAETGAPTEASVLVAQGLLEVYDPASEQFGGFDPAPVRVAAGHDLTPAQLAQRLRAASAAIDAARTTLDIDHADLTLRMLDVATGLYQSVHQPDFIDPLEYQHSFGAALAARDALAAGRRSLRPRNAAAYDEGIAEFDRFIGLWPQTSAPEQPSTYQSVLAQSSRVRLALSPLL